MPFAALLPIAKGAFAIGKKLFAGIRARKEKKAAKKAAKATAAQNSLAEFNKMVEAKGLDFGGSTSISSSGNLLQKFLSTKNDDGGVAGPAVSGGGGLDFKSPPVLIGLLLLAFVLLKAMKIIK